MTAHRRWLILTLLAGAAAGCGAPTGPSDGLLLDAARARWAAGSLRQAYRFELSRSCYCGYPGFLPPTRVTVIGGTITGASNVETGTPVVTAILASIPTVDQLFDLIQTAIDQGVDDLQVRYDADTGVPVEIRIDRSRNTFDDELSITTRNLGPMVTHAHQTQAR